jgi:hypothetical protein
MITPAQIRYLKQRFHIVLWDVMSYDFDPSTSNEKCFSNVTRYAGPGSIIVFHDSVKASENLLYALPRVLEYFGGKGFKFEAISASSAIKI